MLSWIKSCARRVRRVQLVRSAVSGVIERAEAAVIEHMERRLFLDSCAVTTTTIDYTGSSGADDVTVVNSGGTISIKNGGTTICNGSSATVTNITLSGGDGNDTISGAGSPVAVTINGGAGRDLLIGSPSNDAIFGFYVFFFVHFQQQNC